MKKVIVEDIETTTAIKYLLKKLRRDYIGKPCNEFNLDCAHCRAMMLEGHLEWLLDLEEWVKEQDEQERGK